MSNPAAGGEYSISDMTCPDLEQLERYIARDEAGSADADVSEHLSTCASCRDRLDEIRSNIAMVAPIQAALSNGHDGRAPRRGIESGPPPSRVGQFEIEREIGRGGMGIVYLARQRHPRRAVALKLMHPFAASDTLLRRFEREANILGLLHHSGIAQVHEAGIADVPGPDGVPIRVPYIAMEYIQGQRLEDYIRDRQPDLRTRLGLLIRIARALHHAHDHDVIHRDLKPGNVLVVADEQGDPIPKILDFGVARWSESEEAHRTLATNPGQIMGTVPFMSPEQIAGDSSDIDVRSDVYALGVLGFWMLSGRLPHDLERRSLVEAARVIREEDPMHLSTVRADLRGDVETIISTAMEKDRERRYATAGALADDLERHLRDEPIRARPASAMYQLAKFTRRNRGLVAALMAILTVLVAASVVSTAQALRATRNERIARGEAEKFSAVNSFLIGMLSSIDPMLAPDSRDITMREVLDDAVAQLEAGTLAGNPSVEVPVRLTIGETYKSLGVYDEAERHFRRAVELLESDDAADPIELAEALNKLARAREEQGELEDAESVYRRALDLARNHERGTQDMAGKLLNNLGLLHHRMGESAKGETEVRRAIEIRERDANQEIELASSLNNLAIIRQAQGDLAEAETLYARSLAIDRRHRGELHPNIATTLSNLGLLRRARGDLEGAEADLREVLDLRLKTVGRQHPFTAIGLNNLSVVLRDQGRFAEAETVSREALQIDEAIRGPSHPGVANTRYNLANTIAEQGRLDEAEAMHRIVLDVRREVLPEHHPDILASQYQLARIHMRRESWGPALALLDEILDGARSSLPEGHAFLGTFLQRKGECLIRLGRHEEAEDPLLEAHAILSAARGESHPSAQSVVDQLIDLYRALEKEDQLSQWITRKSDETRREGGV